MAAVSRRRVVLLLIFVLLTWAATAVAAASSSPTGASAPDDTKPSILTPIAHTPVGSFEGAEGAVADSAIDDDDAAPVGSPIGTTMTEPEPELAPLGPPGDSSSATAASSVRGPAAAAAVAGAALAVAAGSIFVF